MIDVLFDMETSDPDDFLTLCLLASHPLVKLRAVTVTPGTREQIGVVRYVLDATNRDDVSVGSRNPDHDKNCVSPFHYQFIGPITPRQPDDLAHRILAATLRQFPQATVLTGAPLHNLRLLHNNHSEIAITRWVAQGGFAGDSVVPVEHRLAKFAGRETCPTFNFNGDAKGAKLLLSSPRIHKRYLISKNVCHGVAYDTAMHRLVEPVSEMTPGLHLLYRGMDLYLQKRPQGKIFHDPLAACVAINPDICRFREVEVYREKGEWGSRLKEGTATFISVSVDRAKFVETLSMC